MHERQRKALPSGDKTKGRQSAQAEKMTKELSIES